jgi:hypothetical protein
LSFRLGGTDGVSVEAAKWAWALKALGFSVTTVAGEGSADVIVPGLARDGEGASHREVAAAVEGAEVVVVENLLSLPMNPSAFHAVARVLRGRAAVLRHHDLPWQRPQFTGWTVADDPAWAHVAINDASRSELSEREIDAVLLYNRFPLGGWNDGDGDGVRAALGLSGPVLLHPVRAIPRKDVPAALRLAESRAMTYWLTGPAEDGYEAELAAVLSAASCPVVRGGVERAADMYAAADVVALTSTVEGFGNPLIESALARRPIVVRPYPVAVELASAFGFRWFEDEDDVDANERIARASFGLDGLPAELAAVLERVL